LQPYTNDNLAVTAWRGRRPPGRALRFLARRFLLFGAGPRRADEIAAQVHQGPAGALLESRLDDTVRIGTSEATIIKVE
jgi:hypothetical protein